MTIHLGNVDASSVIYIPFHTFNSSGASVTLTGLAATDIEIYKNGSTTQRSSDAGYTLLDTDGIDFDGITGVHGFSIDLADNTDAGFYAAGSFYWVVISAVTVDSQTVNFVAATFKIGPVSANVTQLLGTAWLTPGTAGTPDVNVKLISDDATAANNAESFFDGTGYAGTNNVIPLVTTTTTATTTTNLTNLPAITANWLTATGIAADAITAAKIADGAIDTATFASGATIPRVTLADTLTTYTGNTPQTGDSFARLGAPAGASVSADVAAINAKTTNLPTDPADDSDIDAQLAAIAGYLDTEIAAIISGNSAIQASVNDLPTNAELATALAALNNLSAAQVNAEVVDVLRTDTIPDSVPADGSLPTAVQALYMVLQFLTEKSVSGTTLTVRKVDGSTSLATYTLNDATSPTSITRAS